MAEPQVYDWDLFFGDESTGVELQPPPEQEIPSEDTSFKGEQGYDWDLFFGEKPKEEPPLEEQPVEPQEELVSPEDQALFDMPDLDNPDELLKNAIENPEGVEDAVSNIVNADAVRKRKDEVISGAVGQIAEQIGPYQAAIERDESLTSIKDQINLKINSGDAEMANYINRNGGIDIVANRMMESPLMGDLSLANKFGIEVKDWYREPIAPEDAIYGRFINSFGQAVTLGHTRTRPQLPATDGYEVFGDVAGGFLGMLLPFSQSIRVAGLAISTPINGAKKLKSLSKVTQYMQNNPKVATWATGWGANIVGFNIHEQMQEALSGQSFSERISHIPTSAWHATLFSSVGAMKEFGKLATVASYPAVGWLGYSLVPDVEDAHGYDSWSDEKKAREGHLNQVEKISSGLVLATMHRVGTGTRVEGLMRFLESAGVKSKNTKLTMIEEALKTVAKNPDLFKIAQNMNKGAMEQAAGESGKPLDPRKQNLQETILRMNPEEFESANKQMAEIRAEEAKKPPKEKPESGQLELSFKDELIKDIEKVREEIAEDNKRNADIKDAPSDDVSISDFKKAFAAEDYDGATKILQQMHPDDMDGARATIREASAELKDGKHRTEKQRINMLGNAIDNLYRGGTKAANVSLKKLGLISKDIPEEVVPDAEPAPISIIGWRDTNHGLEGTIHKDYITGDRVKIIKETNKSLTVEILDGKHKGEVFNHQKRNTGAMGETPLINSRKHGFSVKIESAKQPKKVKKTQVTSRKGWRSAKDKKASIRILDAAFEGINEPQAKYRFDKTIHELKHNNKRYRFDSLIELAKSRGVYDGEAVTRSEIVNRLVDSYKNPMTKSTKPPKVIDGLKIEYDNYGKMKLDMFPAKDLRRIAKKIGVWKRGMNKNKLMDAIVRADGKGKATKDPIPAEKETLFNEIRDNMKFHEGEIKRLVGEGADIKGVEVQRHKASIRKANEILKQIGEKYKIPKKADKTTLPSKKAPMTQEQGRFIQDIIDIHRRFLNRGSETTLSLEAGIEDGLITPEQVSPILKRIEHLEKQGKLGSVESEYFHEILTSEGGKTRVSVFPGIELIYDWFDMRSRSKEAREALTTEEIDALYGLLSGKELSVDALILANMAMQKKPLTKSLKRKGLGGVFTELHKFVEPLQDMSKADQQDYLRARYNFAGNKWHILKGLEELVSEYDNYTFEERHHSWLALHGEAPMKSIKDKNLRELTETIRSHFDEAGQTLVDIGEMSQEAYDGLKGAYLTRVYLRYLMDKGPQLGGRSKMAQNYQNLRKEMSPHIRSLLGEVITPEVPVTLGLMREFGDIAKHEFFTDIMHNDAFTFQPSILSIPHSPGSKKTRSLGIGAATSEIEVYKDILPHAEQSQQAIIKEHILTLERAIEAATALAGDAPEGYKQMPHHRGYGPLAGAYMKKSVHDDLVSVFQITENSDYRGYDEAFNTLEKRATALWKTSKVAFNVPTIMRNTLSNPWQLSMSGMSYPDIILKMGEAAKKMAQGHEDYLAAGESGVFSGTWSQSEIQQMLLSMKDVQREWDTSQDFGLAVRKGFSSIAGAYGKIDEFYKFTKFLNGKSKGMDNLDAAIDAQKWVMDYSLVSPMTRVLREKWWGIPFITYQQKILPLIAEAAWKRPWTLLAPTIIATGQTMNMMKKGELTEKEHAMNLVALGEGWGDSSTLLYLPMKDEKGRMQMVNLEYALPWSFWHEAVNNFHSGDIAQLRNNMGLTPTVALLSALYTGVIPTMDGGYIEIWDENSTITEKSIAMTELAWNTAMPSMLGTRGAIANIFKDKAVGEIETTDIQDWSKFSGFTIKPIDVPLGYDKAMRIHEYHLRKLSMQKSSALKKLPKRRDGTIILESEEALAIEKKYTNKQMESYKKHFGPLITTATDENGDALTLGDLMELTQERLVELLKN